MTVARELPHEPAHQRPTLLRIVEFGPPPLPDPAPDTRPGWRAPLLAGLPRLRPAPPAAAPEPPPPRPIRTLVTDAEARGLAGATARLILEVLEGRRPAHQLDAALSDRAASTVRTMLRGGLRWPVRHAAVRSLHVHQPTARAIEACVVFLSDTRHRALALRLDRDRRRWLATAVRIG